MLKTEIQQRLVRMRNDTKALRETLSSAQVRAAYDQLEAIRDTISDMLNHADGKHV